MNLHRRTPQANFSSGAFSLGIRTRRLAPFGLVAALLAVSTGPATHAQQLVAVDAAMPDAPSAVAAELQSSTQQPAPSSSASANAGTGGPHQTKRILGVIPNFRAVSADQKLPPMKPREKFTSTFQQSFDYSAFILPAVLAGIGEANNSVPAFHKGAAGYGRYYWHNFVDQTDENFMVQAFLPIALHQDNRYYTLGHGGLLKRSVYAFGRVLITRSDSDREVFNASEIVGAGAAAGISNLYYPRSERDWTKTGQRWFLNVAIDGGTFLFQEFWPNLNDAFFHQKN